MRSSDPYPALARLERVLDAVTPSAIAVSGGVDSMTLAVLAGRRGGDVMMFHAVSPAVPPEATARVREHAAREGWRLRILDAGEFDDPRYRSNPVNRCYFCKTNLYASIGSALGRESADPGARAARPERVLLSGTNTDDLGDFRPGLKAAAEHEVRHPYVEAAIDKATVRALARVHALHDLSELPAAPCLSSRVQTGIAVDARDLAAIHAVETLVAEALRPGTVRCRVRDAGIVIELDRQTLDALSPLDGTGRPAPGAGPGPSGPADDSTGDPVQRLRASAREAFAGHRPGISVRFAPYAMGSAFVRGTDRR